MNTQDPRHRNDVFAGNSASSYFLDYQKSLQQALQSVNLNQIDQAFDLIFQAVCEGKKILIAGNGGSAGISDHLACDLGKGTMTSTAPAIKVISLTANGPLVTAIGNDYGYDQIFSTQVNMYGEKGDVLITISSSGNSPNILKALESAHTKGLRTVALTGFSGGKSKDMCDVSLHFNFKNYGIIEDCHQAILQSLGQFLAKKRDESTKPLRSNNDE